MPDLRRDSINPAAIEAVKQIVANDPWPGTPWIDDAELIIAKCYKDYKSPKQIQAGFVGMRFVWRGSMLDTLLAIRTSLTQEKNIRQQLIVGLDEYWITTDEGKAVLAKVKELEKL